MGGNCLMGTRMRYGREQSRSEGRLVQGWARRDDKLFPGWRLANRQGEGEGEGVLSFQCFVLLFTAFFSSFNRGELGVYVCVFFCVCMCVHMFLFTCVRSYLCVRACVCAARERVRVRACVCACMSMSMRMSVSVS